MRLLYVAWNASKYKYVTLVVFIIPVFARVLGDTDSRPFSVVVPLAIRVASV